MLIPLAYWTFLLIAVATSWRVGDQQDRRVLLAVVGANSLTAIAQVLLTMPYEPFAIAGIGLALFMVLARHAVVSQRHWPIWFAGFQAAAVVLGLAATFLPTGTPRLTLALAAAFWSLPALVFMAMGLLLDRRGAVSDTTL